MFNERSEPRAVVDLATGRYEVPAKRSWNSRPSVADVDTITERWRVSKGASLTVIVGPCTLREVAELVLRWDSYGASAQWGSWTWRNGWAVCVAY
jgi:3-deoxy-D-arabino-heptulosonate 7-phosphate (DAHP) synthase